jgi:tRNA threonylcarbamoyladenosine biosynthesis protein TsaB
MTAVTLIAFDTSTECLAVAVRASGGRWCEAQAGGAAASAALLPALRALLGRAGCSMAEVDAIAFGRGPGAFTGLRTSCAVAQGLAVGLGRLVLPIDSLLIVAEQARQASGALAAEAAFDVGVAMDARMGEVYAARYLWSGGAGDVAAWQTLEPPALWAPDALARAWGRDRAPPAFCAGSGLALIGAAAPLPGACIGISDIGDIGNPARAAALLTLAEQAWRAGAAIDAALALPVYLRDKVALTTAERAERAEHARRAGSPAATAP